MAGEHPNPNDPSQFVLASSATPVAKGQQVKYGAVAHLSAGKIQRLKAHYNTAATTNEPDQRLTQYSIIHSTYVRAAQASQRDLTAQEQRVEQAEAALANRAYRSQKTQLETNCPNGSINHIIAASTGQNILNGATVNFIKGKALAPQIDEVQAQALELPKLKKELKAAHKELAALDDETNVTRAQRKEHEQTVKTATEALDQAKTQYQETIKKAHKGIALQAASVGVALHFARVIHQERKGEFTDTQVSTAIKTSHKDILAAFEHPKAEKRWTAYKSYMANTFDSPGNLRIGDNKANIKISSGIDVELNPQGCVTPRSGRLMYSALVMSPQRLHLQELFTKSSAKKIMSSSQVAPRVDAPVR